MNNPQTVLFYFVLVSCLLIPNTSKAEVSLPAIVSSNMVLQRNTTITLWGWADGQEELQITASWLKKPINIAADQGGDWKVEVQTTGSKAPQTIKIKSKGKDIVLENILFGEVWLCSGQSNMEQPVAGFYGQPTFGALEAISTAKNDRIRLFTAEKQASTVPRNDLENYLAWQTASPESVKNFSAVAYFFGQALQDILDVPVGLIHSSWGGSLIEAWMSKEVLSSIKEIDLTDVDLNRGNRFPTVLFNAMINPLIPFTIKGAIWYQGEANASRPGHYKELFPAMVKDWRTRWGNEDFPFYFVQIAPYMYDSENRMDARNNVALMREAQLECLDLIPNSGIAITLDIGEDYVIHPAKKKEVADRLLYNALNQTYGYKAVDFSGPVYDSMEVKDEGIYISFKNAEMGLYAPGELTGFEIAGADKVFYPADASLIKRRQVFVKNEQVKNPLAVRYAWRSWTTGTLFDTFLLPASSFRTDHWDDAAESKL